MSEYLFNRKVHLAIGPYGGEGILITENYVQFDIDETSDSTINKGTIKVYNLNEDSRTLLENNKTGKELFCKLQVGYATMAEMTELFSGTVTRTRSTKEGKDYISVIELGDGVKEQKNAKSDKSYKGSTANTNILTDVVKSFGLSLGKSDLAPETFQSGMALSGSSKNIMDKLVKKQGMEWHIRAGQIHILKPRGSNGEEAIVLSLDSGMIGAPIKKDDGIEVKALIQPNLHPGRAVKIEAELIKGLYRIRTAKFSGDNKNGPWEVMLTCVEVK